MCGIAGILNFNSESVDPSVIKRMTDIIEHRGPDSEGCWINGPVGLGHRRLSIIDLSNDGRQPMLSETGRNVISFNGEIYNYKELAKMLRNKGYELRTKTDTEVILKLYDAYGTDCLEYLRGMFAFSIWDKEKSRLFLARDRIGIKPLYFLKTSERIVFGSEIKAVVASGFSDMSVDASAICGYLRFLVIPQPQTIFSDVHKLEPGTYMLISVNGKTRTHEYWSAKDYIYTGENRSESESVSQLDELLNESIRYHMVADVPVSAFLSGGLDSSAVVALMRKNNSELDLKTFATIFPRSPEIDEGKYAKIVAAEKSTSHVENEFDESFLDEFSKIAWHLDEPFAVTSAYATYYLAQSAAKETKVVLTGDGGDELFAGYNGYKNDSYLSGSGLQSKISQLVYRALLVIKNTTGINGNAVNRIITGLARRSGSDGLRYSEQIAQNSFYASSLVMNNDLFNGCLKSWEENLVANYYDEIDSDENLIKKLYAEMKTRLVDEMLMKVDRMTMAHSLEARVPLLDHKVAQFALQLPPDLKLHTSNGTRTTKYILKRVMESYLPREIIYRNKQGFNIPVRTWMEGGFLKKAGDRLREGAMVESGMFSRAGLDELLKSQRDGKHNYNNMLILLLAFDSWMESYKSNLGKVTFH